MMMKMTADQRQRRLQQATVQRQRQLQVVTMMMMMMATVDQRQQQRPLVLHQQRAQLQVDRRQQPRRHVTVFEQCYVERHGDRRTEHRFELQFRTLPMRQMISRVEEAGFSIDAVLGDYRGRAWDERSDVWIILATRA